MKKKTEENKKAEHAALLRRQKAMQDAGEGKGFEFREF